MVWLPLASMASTSSLYSVPSSRNSSRNGIVVMEADRSVLQTRSTGSSWGNDHVVANDLATTGIGPGIQLITTASVGSTAPSAGSITVGLRGME